MLGSLNLVLASVPPRDKVGFQANFHMKAAENFPSSLEFQAAPWALTSQTHSLGPTFPHPHILTPPLYLYEYGIIYLANSLMVEHLLLDFLLQILLYCKQYLTFLGSLQPVSTTRAYLTEVPYLSPSLVLHSHSCRLSAKTFTEVPGHRSLP